KTERDNHSCRFRHDRLGIAEVRQDRRSVARAVSSPLPFLGAAGHFIRDDSAAALAPELGNAQPVHDDRRTGGEQIPRRILEIVLAPELLSGRVVTRQDSADAEDHDLAVGHGWRATWTGKAL